MSHPDRGESRRVLQRVMRAHEAARRSRRILDEAREPAALFDRICECLVDVGGYAHARLAADSCQTAAGAGYRRPVSSPARLEGMLEVVPEAGETLSPEEREVLDGLVENLEAWFAARTSRHDADKMRGLVNAAPVGIVIYLDGKMTFANPKAAEIVGASSVEAMLGPSLFDLLSHETATASLARIVRFLDGDDSAYPATDRYIRKDGSFVDVELDAARVELGGQTGLIVLAEDVTDARRVQVELRESEARFRRVFEAANVGKSITKRDGTVDVNRAFAEMLGYSPEELVDKTWQELTPPEDIPAIERALVPLLAGEQDELRLRKRYLHKTGEEIWADMSSVAWRNASGDVETFITTIVDITEQRRADEQRRQDHVRLDAAFELAGIASWTYDFVKDEFEFDDRFYALFGTDVETEGGYRMRSARFIERFVHSEDRSLVKETVAAARRSKAPFHDDQLAYRLVRRDGGIQHVAVHYKVDGDALGRPVRAFGANQDVTQRVEAERLRVESEAFVRLVMDSLPVGVAVGGLASGSALSFMNGAFSEILRTPVSALEAPGALWGALFEDPTVQERFRSRVLESLSAKGASSSRVTFENLVLARAEGRAHVALTFVPIPERELCIVLVRDVTARHRAETERAEMEEQFLAAQRLEAVGRLAGGVAHDFNNLLSVIINYAEFLVEDLHEADPMRADVQEIMTAGKRAAALTRQLLAFSRRQVLQPEVIDLDAVISGLERMLKRLLGEDIAVQTYLNKAPHVLADPGQIEQVIMNLVVNARDAMPGGGVLTLETSFEVIDGAAASPVELIPGRYACLAVTDTGVGMEEATRARIFEPFFTTKEKGKGTGLGLSTVYGIVQQSGGAITVQSAPNRGTTFNVWLPLVDDDAVEVGPATVDVQRGNETILVVEDEEVVRRLTERILRAAGYHVLTAASGGDALVLCEKEGESIELLLTDVVMPQLSGVELAGRLRDIWPNMGVLYMSGYTDEAIGEHGVVAPDVVLVTKPFSAAELTKRVREVLDSRPAEAGRGSSHELLQPSHG